MNGDEMLLVSVPQYRMCEQMFHEIPRCRPCLCPSIGDEGLPLDLRGPLCGVGLGLGWFEMSSRMDEHRLHQQREFETPKVSAKARG